MSNTMNNTEMLRMLKSKECGLPPYFLQFLSPSLVIHEGKEFAFFLKDGKHITVSFEQMSTTRLKFPPFGGVFVVGIDGKQIDPYLVPNGDGRFQHWRPMLFTLKRLLR